MQADLLAGFPSVGIQAREAHVTLCLCFQDIIGLEAVLGEKEARELCGNLSNKVFLAADSEAASNFASTTMSKREVIEIRNSVALSPQGETRTRVEHLAQRELVLPGEFMDLPLPTWSTGVIEGYFKSPFTGRYKATIPFRDAVERLRPTRPYPKYVQRPAEQQRLAPLNEADVKRLRLPMSPVIRAAISGGA